MKYWLLLSLILSASTALADAYRCTSVKSSKIKLSLDLDAHPLDEAETIYGIDAYLDAADYGQGNILMETAGHSAEVRAENPLVMSFDNGMVVTPYVPVRGCENGMGISFDDKSNGISGEAFCCVSN